jgi:hypothetical protein
MSEQHNHSEPQEPGDEALREEVERFLSYVALTSDLDDKAHDLWVTEDGKRIVDSIPFGD